MNAIEVSSYDEMMSRLMPIAHYKSNLRNFRVLATCEFCGNQYETSALCIYERHRLNKADFECASCRGQKCVKFAQYAMAPDRRSSLSKEMWKTRNHKVDDNTKLKLADAAKKQHARMTEAEKKSLYEKRSATIRNWDEAQRQSFKEKREKTFLEKYGVKSLTDIQKARRKYIYNNLNFDSSIELAYYIFLVDKKVPFEYHPNVFFEYEYKNEVHKYYPDFLVKNIFVELKGSQFLKEDGSWRDIYNGNDDKMECKHQCLLQNNVKIIYDFEMTDVLDYIKSTYGKAFLNKFKRRTKAK